MSHSKYTRCFCVLLLSFVMILAPGCSKESKIKGYLKRADGHFAAKDFLKAEIEYLSVLKLDPNNLAAVKQLAILYYEQGNIQQAVRYLAGVRELDKDDLGARIKLAQILLSAGAFPDARKVAIEILDRDPKNDDAIVLLSDTAVTSADLSDTQQRLEKLEAQASDRAAWHLAMASLSLRKKDVLAAEAALGKALALEPESSQLHLARALIYWMKKDLKNADVFFQKAAELAPLNAGVCLRRAEFKLNTGFPKEGREILEQFTQKVPDSTPVWLYLARLGFDDQKYPECAKIVERIRAKDPANYQARLLHASLTRVQGTPADAVKEAETLTRAFERSAEAHFELTLAHLKNQDPVKAGASLQETLRLNPDLSQAALLYAELLVQKGDSATALSLLETLVQKHPEITRAQLLLGGAYTSQRRLDEALALYKAMEQRFPKVPDVPFLIGMALRQQPSGKGNAEARKAFDRAAAMSPNDPLVTYQLVDLDILDKAFPAALERVRILLENKPKSGGAKVIEARIFLAQNKLTEAEAALKEALEWEPNSSSAYNLLTQTYLIGNKLPEALENMEETVKKNPKSVSVLMQMAVILEKKGDTAKAITAYQDIVKIAPDFVPALNNLAVILSSKPGKLDEAFALATKVRELSPQTPSVADTLGWIHFRRHEYFRALALLKQSAAKVPDEPEFQFHVGMAYYMMGEEGSARQALTRALERKKEDPALPAALRALEQEAQSWEAEVKKRLAGLDLDPGNVDQGAITSLQNAIREQPDDLPSILRLGRIYERTGAPEKARQAYEDARKINPGSVSAVIHLARLLSTNPKYRQQALALATEARTMAPEDAEVAHLLGSIAFQSGEPAKAADLLQESSRKQPANLEILFELAQAVYAVGRVNDAEDTMRRAVQSGGLKGEPAQEAQTFLDLLALAKTPAKQLDAESQVQAALKTRPDFLPALMVASLIDEQRGRFPEAKQKYEKILITTPQFAPARKQLAALYTDHFSDQQKAQEHASKAREILTNDPELGKTLGKIAYRRGDFPGAILFLKESSLKRAEDGEIFYFLGMAQNQRKAKEESKVALKRALTLSPNAPFVPEVQKVLAELEK